MREAQLIKDGSPCDTDFTDMTIQTIEDARNKGKCICSNQEECIKRSQAEGIHCGRQIAQQMANFILNNKKPLEEALAEERKGFLLDENLPDGKIWVCDKDGNWIIVEGKESAADYILQFAQTIIDLRPGERRPFTKDGMRIPEMGPKDALHNAVVDLQNVYAEVGAKSPFR